MRFIFLVLLTIFVKIISGEPTLKHVFVTYGIPHHTPVDYTSPQEGKARYTFTKISEDKGNLSKNGIDEAFEFGQYLAKAYGQNLDIRNWEAKYYWTFGMSTNLTKQTAYIVAAGLKNDTNVVTALKNKNDDERWAYENLDHSENPKVDEFEKFGDEKKCPEYWKTLRNTVGMELVFSVINAKRDTISVIDSHVGSIANVNSRLLRFVYLTLQMKKDIGETLEWANENVMKDMEFISSKDLFLGQKTDKLKKLSGGRLADAILKDIEKVKKGEKVTNSPEDSNPKISIFAALQDILASQIAAFNPKGTRFNGAEFTYDTFYPDIGAAHIIELYQDQDQWKVKILYRNKKDNQFQSVKLPKCGEDNFCKFDDLKEDLKSILLTSDDQKTECIKKKQ